MRMAYSNMWGIFLNSASSFIFNVIPLILSPSPEVSHVRDLLLSLPEATLQTSDSRKPTPQPTSRGASSRPGSRASPRTTPPAPTLESPISEPPLSPPPSHPTPEPDVDAQPIQNSADAMEVDETEISVVAAPQAAAERLASQSPAPLNIKRRSRSTTVPVPLERHATPKFSPSHSRTPPPQIQPNIETAHVVENETPQQLELQPTIIPDVEMDVQSGAEVTTPKIEDTSEEVLMESHSDPPLPLGRIDSEHSTAGYVLERQIAPDQPPPSYEFNEESMSPSSVEEKTVAPGLTLYKPLTFALPPLKVLPPEFYRKAKQRQSRKRDKEKTETKPVQEWTPMSLNKWCAMLRANPVHKKVSKASKCLNTREWNVCP